MTTEQIKQKRLELLEDTAKHFNSSNRSLSEGKDGDPGCIYSGVGCAIGRLIEDKELCKKLDSLKDEKGRCATGVCNSSVFHSLPEELKCLGREFLIQLQALHDISSHWEATGLSMAGKSAVDSIRGEFCK